MLLVINDLSYNLASYLDEADKFSNFSNTNLCVLIFSILIDESFVSIFHRKNLTSLSNNIIFSSLSTSDTHTKHDISTLNWKYCQKQRKDCFQYCFLLNLKFFFRWTAPRYVSHHIQIFAPTTNLFHIFFYCNFAWLFHAS